MLTAELKTLRALLRPASRSPHHAERLEHFYRDQAEHYDEFRERLLRGRRELVDALPLAPGATWVDLGGGTAHNCLRAEARLGHLAHAVVVDLTPSLLAMANQRRLHRRWTNVTLVRADAGHVPLPDAIADVVTCSYALTMMPEWRRVLSEAYRVLKPSGTFGAVDFYISSAHGLATRRFWPWWFRHRHVLLNDEHLPALARLFDTRTRIETRAPVPYLPLGRVPIYRFIGTKP